jgi:beta-lactam-binding protein with PASTA domain
VTQSRGLDLPSVVVGHRGAARPATVPGLHVHVTFPGVPMRRHAVVETTVTNRTGETVSAQLLAVSSGGAVTVDPAFEATLTLLAGESQTVRVVLRARRSSPLRTVRHAVTLLALPRPDGGLAADPEALAVLGSSTLAELHLDAEGHPVRTPGLRHRPADLTCVVAPPAPRWALAGAVLAVAAAGAALLVPALGDDGVEVPSLIGLLDANGADRSLSQQGLVLDPDIRSVASASVPPGSVLRQQPEAGTRAEARGMVTITVAVGTRKVRVPRLEGLDRDIANARLRAVGLTLGPTRPSGTGGTVAGQLPAARGRVPVGAAVSLFLRGAVAPGEPVGDAGPANPKIPARRGTPTTYAAALAERGLVPKIIRIVRPGRAGRLVGVTPAPGTIVDPGTGVRLMVTAGVPALAYDTGTSVQITDTVKGRVVADASPSGRKAVEPAWSTGGSSLVYRVDRRLVLTKAGLSDNGRVLYDGPVTYTTPVYAPAAPGTLLALIRRKENDGDLCFARVGRKRLKPACIADKGWDLGRQISWSPDGRSLLVFGVQRGKRSRFGLLRYRSARAFSGRPGDWRFKLATDASTPFEGVIGGAYSPSGRRVALITNVGLKRFQLAVAPASGLSAVTREMTLPVRACEVAWRPDGKEVAVVQSDSDCGEPVGILARVDVAHPRRVVVSATAGRHPAYQPLQYGGPGSGAR